MSGNNQLSEDNHMQHLIIDKGRTETLYSIHREVSCAQIDRHVAICSFSKVWSLRLSARHDEVKTPSGWKMESCR